MQSADDSANRERTGQEVAERVISRLPIFIYTLDIDRTTISFVNRSMMQALGYADGADSLQRWMHPDDWQSFLAYVKRLADLRDGECANVFYRLLHQDGNWRWFHSRDVVFTRDSAGRVHEILATVIDVTEQKNAEERAGFLSNLGHALLTLADPDEIMAVAVRMTAEFLAVDRCGYGEVEAGQFVIMRDYVRGSSSSIVGRYAMSDFPQRERRILEENRPYVVNDIRADSPPEADVSMYERAGIRSIVCVPLNKRGSFVARLSVQQSTARQWSSADIDILTKVAERCWESVERARALRRLKDSEDRYRAFLANSSEAIYRYELEKPISVGLPVEEQIEDLFRYAYLAECNDAMARMYGYQRAEEILGARIGDLLVRSDPQNIACLRALHDSGYHLTDFETHEADRYGNTKHFLNNLIAIEENGALVRAWGTQRDVTGQKLAAKALQQSEQRLRRITDATQDALWEIDLKTNQLWWSESARRLFGRSTGTLDIRMADWYSAIHPEDVDRVRDKFEKFMSSNEDDWTDEYRFQSSSGSYIYITDQGRKFRDESGAPNRIAGAMRDITRRKTAEAALRESEERFAKAFKASPDALVISRIADGVVLEVNDSFVALSGYSREDIVGNSTLLLGLYSDPAVREKAVKIIEKENRVRNFEFVMKRKSGERRTVLFSAEPLELRGERCWLTIGRDITEQKHAEEALRASEEEARRQLAYIEAIYATAPVGLCFVDTDLRFTSINDRLAEFHGKPVSELLGRTLRESAPNIAATVEPHFRRVIETGEPVLNVEMSAPDRDGAVHHFVNSYYPIKGWGGRVVGVNVVAVDITQRKAVEQERERLLAREKAAREAAESANRMKDEFLATISHELRTPLTSILGWARVLKNGTLPESQMRHALDVIEKGATSQAQLIDDILDTSRIITGRLKLDAHPMEIAQVFEAAVDVVRPSAEAKRIDLHVAVEDRKSLVYGDPNRLQQAIWNLLANAVKFTTTGGRIDARLTREGDDIEISVTDSGMGIDSQFLPYVFDRFRQADSTSTRKYGGLGLGLAIVRHVIEMHGGAVRASSPGKDLGSTFVIRLPVAASMRRAQAPAQSERPGLKAADCGAGANVRQLNGVTVLVVDDDADTLEMLRFILDTFGARVVTAASSDEALAVMQRLHPDVLVSDIAMPISDGYELLAKMRSTESASTREVPAIALTAYARSEDRERALAAGFEKYISKPIDPGELVNVVANLAGRPPKQHL